MIDLLCNGCDLPFPVNDLGLCDACFAKLERDLIRARDWEYSATAFGVDPDNLETLRQRVIQQYGDAYELIAPPDAPAEPQRKNKRTHLHANQRKREITLNAQRNYSTANVLKAARDVLQAQGDVWVNFSVISQHLHERFYKLKPKHLGEPGKKYSSLLKFLMDYPAEFELRQDDAKRGVYWMRMHSS